MVGTSKSDKSNKIDSTSKRKERGKIYKDTLGYRFFFVTDKTSIQKLIFTVKYSQSYTKAYIVRYTSSS